MQILKTTFLILAHITSIVIFIRIYQWICEKLGIYSFLDKLWQILFKIIKR